MRLTVRLRPNARVEKVEKLSDREYRVWVRAPAREGKANDALIRLLSDHFGRPRSAVTLVRGAASRNKRVEIL
jgi:uncharacterized protein (TIGR00251 family)